MNKKVLSILPVIIVLFIVCFCFVNQVEAIKTSTQDPVVAQDYNMKAQFEFLKGEYDTAQSYYEKAIQHDINNADAHYGLGLIYTMKKEYETAIEYFNKAKELDPSLKETADQSVRDILTQLEAQQQAGN